ncbi:MAG: phosphoribosyltransferase family protein [Patescibacteria group bacterium]
MIKEILSFFIDLLFVKKCIICNRIDCETICVRCFQRIKTKEQRCPACSSTNNFGEFCDNCNKGFYFNGIMVAGDLNDKILEELIKKFKYKFNKKIGNILGLFLLNFLKEKINPNPILKKDNLFNEENSIIIAVPITKRRERWRGFNQSFILASFISQKTKIPIFNNLIKIKNSKNQASLKKKDREKNLNNCFKIIDPEESKKILENKKIILVDDITTTGSTINEISKELKKYKPVEIWGLVLAKK